MSRELFQGAMGAAVAQQGAMSAAGQSHIISDAPTPWRTAISRSEIAAVLDARGHTVTLCRREIAERIVAAVNGVETRS